MFKCLLPGFEGTYGLNKLCKLKKSLHGLKHPLEHGLTDLERLWKVQGTVRVKLTISYSKDQKRPIASVNCVYWWYYHHWWSWVWNNDWRRNSLRILNLKTSGRLTYLLGIGFARLKEKHICKSKKLHLRFTSWNWLLGCKVVDAPVGPNVRLNPTNTEDIRFLFLYLYKSTEATISMTQILPFMTEPNI